MVRNGLICMQAERVYLRYFRVELSANSIQFIELKGSAKRLHSRATRGHEIEVDRLGGLDRTSLVFDNVFL